MWCCTLEYNELFTVSEVHVSQLQSKVHATNMAECNCTQASNL